MDSSHGLPAKFQDTGSEAKSQKPIFVVRQARLNKILHKKVLRNAYSDIGDHPVSLCRKGTSLTTVESRVAVRSAYANFFCIPLVTEANRKDLPAI